MNIRSASPALVALVRIVTLAAILLPLGFGAPAAAQTAESLFTTQTPAVPNANDGVTYELGLKLRSAKVGQVTAIRYWKAVSESGTHVGRVWSSTGTLLASVPFTGETASGWQQQALTTPLNIQANTTYVVSVNVNALYAATLNALATAVVNGDLASVADGANGVYGASGTFPTSSYQNANYFRDVVFVSGATSSIVKASGDAQTAPAGSTLPQPFVVRVANANGTAMVGAGVAFAVTAGGGSVSAATATTDSTGQASTTLTLGAAAGANGVQASVTGVGSVAFSATGTVGAAAKLAISPPATNATVGSSTTLSVSVQDAAGNTVTGATNPITVAVQGVSGTFLPAAPLTPTNGVATTSFTASGVGTATISASATGLASATATVTETGIGPPAKIALAPATAAIAVGAPVTLTATIQDANGNAVTSATNPVSFAASGIAGAFSPAGPVTPINGVATTVFTPSAAGTATVTASGTGLAGATSTVTATATASGQSLFTTQTPASPNASDGVAYELGMKFQSAKSGKITGIRYWKAASDGGTHVGKLWSVNGTTGTLLGSVTFTGESASGWQVQALPTPIAVKAATTYVVSVNVTSFYAATTGGLAASIANGSLSSVADGANGVFGTSGAFPTGSFQSSNYFRDVVFLADASTGLNISSGNNQSGLPGTTLPNPLTVVLYDGAGNPVQGATVAFAVASGGGSLSAASAVTGADGKASTTLTLGSASGLGTVKATSGTSSVTFQETSANAIVLENLKSGTSAWQITSPVSTTKPEILGYAGAYSVNQGGSLPFMISLATPGQYTVDVYRLGWYGGAGARKLLSTGPLSGVTQAPCGVTDAATHLIECKWTTSYTLQVNSADWTTGLYIANLTASASGKQSQIWFVVRDDSSRSDIVFQSSFNTYQAYNNFGTSVQASLYDFNSTNMIPAMKVSADRPFAQMSIDTERYDRITWVEYNMARFLESQGYDVSYIVNLDLDLNPALLSQHKVYLDAGHDEYVSFAERDALEHARDVFGTSLAFISGNSVYWAVRFEPSSSGVPNRVMVCYKCMTGQSCVQDPQSPPTTLWADPLINRPPMSLTGTDSVGDDVSNRLGGYNFIVTNASDPYYKNTGVANGTSLGQLVGYEWEAVVNSPFNPAGLTKLSNSTAHSTTVYPELPPGTSGNVSNAARYTAASGAKVFSTGSIQWTWGLDSFGVSPARADPRVQQMFVNVMADMGARPATPGAGLVVP